MATLPERICEVIQKVLGTSPNLCDRVETIEALLDGIECKEVAILDAWGFVGADGTLFNGCNAEAEQVSTGIYQVTFPTTLSSPSYAVTFGNINDGTTRDGRHIEVINGTQNASGFQYYVATGDNGVTADVLVNGQANFHVAGKRKVLVCP